MSPVGKSLRMKITQFPALVNCCTINWFSNWPPEALTKVGQELVKDLYLDNYTQSNLVKSFSYLHTSSMNFATRLRETEGSHFYITPTLFIDMIKVFISMLDVQRTKYEGLKLQYVNGV